MRECARGREPSVGAVGLEFPSKGEKVIAEFPSEFPSKGISKGTRSTKGDETITRRVGQILQHSLSVKAVRCC
jgi:hypothetical protein